MTGYGAEKMKHLYPIMVNLSGRNCLVVGGGPVAERKVQSLLQAGANVTVVSTKITDGLLKLENQSEVVLYRQTFHPSIMTDENLAPYTLVVAATNDAEVNAQVYELASRQGQLVNVVDQPQLSSFIVPSVVRRGKLVIAVSTSGASPSAARKIAQELDDVYGEEYACYLEFLSDLRLIVQSKVSDKQARQRMFKEMLEWDILAKIREGTFERWKENLYIALEKEPWMHGQAGEEETDQPAWSAIKDFGQQV
jgi:precorrin-2 dehydrogenase/sirohydrochlorin ferrochelatase